MAQDILLIRTAKGLVAFDALSEDIIAKLPMNKPIRMKASMARNVGHHRKTYALFNLVFENQEIYPTLENFVIAVKMATGLCQEIKIGGKTAFIPSSISFDKMDQISFNEWYEKVLLLICTKILPGCNNEDLVREVDEIIRGNDAPAKEE